MFSNAAIIMAGKQVAIILHVTPSIRLSSASIGWLRYSPDWGDKLNNNYQTEQHNTGGPSVKFSRW